MSRTITKLAAILVFTAFVPLVASAALIAVPGDHPDLATAFAAARAGDVIELAPGNYSVNDLLVPAGVSLRGMGGDADETVLDGRSRGRILVLEDLPGTVFIQNLTFRNGFALGASTKDKSGGALLVNRSTLMIQNCRFEDNRANAHGGAIRLMNANGFISQCEFVRNKAVLGGGAIDCSFGASPVIERTTFGTNDGGWGGALSCRGDSSPTVRDSGFLTNRTNQIFGYGGAVFADNNSGPQFEGCTFQGNEAQYGGAIGCFQTSSVQLDQCTIVENSGDAEGGGVFCIDGSPTISSSIIAFQAGSGVESTGEALPTISCSNVYGNTSGDVNGRVLDGGGAAEHISVDPQFCGDGFALAPDSPSAGDGECGTMGAWPVGCELEPLRISGFTGELTNNLVRVRWQSAGGRPGAAYRLTWGGSGLPDREMIFTTNADGSFTAFSAEPLQSGGGLVRLEVRNEAGDWTLAAELTFDALGIDDDDQETPPAPAPLTIRNWPNPFNPSTTIAFTMDRAQEASVVIYTLDGRRVKLMARRVFAAGPQELVWDGRDESGQTVSSGSYIVLLKTERASRSHKITLLK